MAPRYYARVNPKISTLQNIRRYPFCGADLDGEYFIKDLLDFVHVLVDFLDDVIAVVHLELLWKSRGQIRPL